MNLIAGAVAVLERAKEFRGLQALGELALLLLAAGGVLD